MGDKLKSQIEYSENINRFLSTLEIDELIRRYSTPLYVIDENTLHRKVKELRDAYSSFKGKTEIAYSIKANFNPSIIVALMKDDIMFDLTAIEELYFYQRCKGDLKRIIYTTVAEEYEEYLHVLKNGVERVVISSYNGLLNLIDAARTIDVKPKTLIRINPEVGVKASIKASYRDGKFGVPLYTNTADNAMHILEHIIREENLQFDGFHFHLGSQITDPTCFINALAKLDQFITKAKDTYDIKVNTLDIGGGTPIFYGETVPTPSTIASSMIDKLNNMSYRHGITNLIVESGRYITAESMIMLSKVVNVKEYNNDKFAILDAGYHLLLDAALLKQQYPQEVIRYDKGKSNKNIHLAGRLCDTYDIFPKSKISKLDDVDINSYIVFYNVGAYSIVFNMPFHCQTKPAVVMKDSNGNLRLVRKEQKIEDLFMEEGGELL
ncbi:MAG: hypothetical protein QW416_00080 [Candidatus Nitrosocaldaceae archaeon]